MLLIAEKKTDKNNQVILFTKKLASKYFSLEIKYFEAIF